MLGWKISELFEPCWTVKRRLKLLRINILKDTFYLNADQRCDHHLDVIIF